METKSGTVEILETKEGESYYSPINNVIMILPRSHAAPAPPRETTVRMIRVLLLKCPPQQRNSAD
jgi:hypothetical protein